VILGIEQGDWKKNVIIGIVGLLMAFFQGFVLFTQYRRARKAGLLVATIVGPAE
jgi:hypothetical protein